MAQHYEVLAVSQLELYPGNPRRGDVKAIKGSIDEHGFYGAVLVQESTNRIVAGNHRYLAALEAGATEVPCILLDIDDVKAEKLLLNANRMEQLGTFDEGELLKMLSGMDDITGTGYDENFLAKLAVKSGEDLLKASRAGKDDSELLATGFHVLITCGTEAEQTLMLERFIEEGLSVKALVV